MRILIAEDNASLAEALQVALTRDGYAVDWVSNGAHADQALRDGVFDLVILDLQLPKLDGYEVLRRLRQRDTSLPVLILSGREKPEQKVLGLDLGADDYLVKPFSLSELHARVRALLRRRQGGDAPVITHGKLSFDTCERRVSIDGAPLHLSRHEIGVLEILLNKFGHIVSKDQLVHKLYTYDTSVSHNAMEVYVHRLRKKIEGSGIAVRTLHGQGYVMEEHGKDANG
ncbi:MAG TPA: response regulator transcription factor [Steroidobacteraceae bacterium]|nr:response regulator transcription factor [Steroidobacteraceae bacterium]